MKMLTSRSQDFLRGKGFLGDMTDVPSWKLKENAEIEGRKKACKVVGATGFEPATPCSRSRCATRLRYAPTFFIVRRGGGKVKNKQRGSRIQGARGQALLFLEPWNPGVLGPFLLKVFPGLDFPDQTGQRQNDGAELIRQFGKIGNLKKAFIKVQKSGGLEHGAFGPRGEIPRDCGGPPLLPEKSPDNRRGDTSGKGVVRSGSQFL